MPRPPSRIPNAAACFRRRKPVGRQPHSLRALHRGGRVAASISAFDLPTPRIMDSTGASSRSSARNRCWWLAAATSAWNWGVDGAHFQADVAAADHQQRLRRRPTRRPVESMIRGVGRSKAESAPAANRRRRCNLEANAVVGQRAFRHGQKPQRLRVLEGGLGVDDLHLSLAADLLQTRGQQGDDLLLLRRGRPAGSSAVGRRRPRLRGVSLRP